MTTQRFEPDAFDPIDGWSLEAYADLCRALVRVPAGSARQLTEALAERSLTPAAWTRIRAGWSDRIARDPFVRGAFQRLYLGDDSALPTASQKGDPT